MRIFYNPQLKQLSRQLRKQGVLSEVLLWQHLKNRKMRGFQFMRQKPIGNYIVDFYCSKLKLVVEIDGESHASNFDYDIQRQLFLESLGITVLRFNDVDVKKDIGSVLMAIGGWIERNNSSSDKGQDNPPNPPLIRGE